MIYALKGVKALDRSRYCPIGDLKIWLRHWEIGLLYCYPKTPCFDDSTWIGMNTTDALYSGPYSMQAS